MKKTLLLTVALCAHSAGAQSLEEWQQATSQIAPRGESPDDEGDVLTVSLNVIAPDNFDVEKAKAAGLVEVPDLRLVLYRTSGQPVPEELGRQIIQLPERLGCSKWEKRNELAQGSDKNELIFDIHCNQSPRGSAATLCRPAQFKVVRFSAFNAQSEWIVLEGLSSTYVHL